MVDPRLTVLMPVYNAERFIREAIDSILKQSFHAFEFLIIDDGSTDRSANIIKSYHDPRIRFVENRTNLGISATLNKGIQLAACPLIARMDADDISRPHRLRKQYDFMMRHPDCAMVSAWAHVIDAEGRHVHMERYGRRFLYYNLTFECWIYHPVVMLRKSAVDTMGGYIKPYSEDYDLFWRLSTKYRIGHLEEPLLDYRLSPTSLNTVTHRKEYEQANIENVMRNIRYHLGNSVSITPSTLACLRHDFSSVEPTDLRSIRDAVAIAKAVAARMVMRNNPNRDVSGIRRAAKFKRRYMLMSMARRLPARLALILLWQSGAWLAFFYLVRDFIKWNVKNIFRKVTGASYGARHHHILRHS